MKRGISRIAVAIIMAGASTCTPSNKENDLLQEEAGFDSPRTVNNDPQPEYLSPEESLHSFRLPKGYHLELVAPFKKVQNLITFLL